MQKSTLLIRSGVTAIAAVLALPSTAAWAQEAGTVTEVATPADPAPATAEPVTATAAPTADPSVATPAPAASTSSKKATPKTVRKAAPKRTVAEAPASVAAPIAAAVEPPAPPADLPLAQAPAMPEPEPVAPADVSSDDAAQMAFGGGLAAVALGGLALIAARRRRRSSEWVEPVAEAPIAPGIHRDRTAEPSTERSAFAWGNMIPAGTPSGADPVALARMGPTPENPSLSLKKRLKRAAFFESRERAAAAGRAVPVARDAGLPERAVNRLRQATGSRQFQLQPA